MNSKRMAIRFWAIATVAWALTFLTSLAIAYAGLGRLPRYGSDPEPQTLGLYPLMLVNFLMLAVGTFGLPVAIFLLIHLKVQEIKLSRMDWVWITIAASCCLLFLLSVTQGRASYLWFMD